MLRHLEAIRFLKFMKSGRTSPVLLGCEDDSGNEGEFVVKPRATGSNGTAGLCGELLGSRLAEHFGLRAPAPGVIELSDELACLIADIEPEKGKSVKQSIGLNFGSEHLTGVTIWPTGKDVPESMRLAALQIFAFDALI